MRQKYYVGYKPGSVYEVFKSATTPTEDTHGHIYTYVIGAFRTKRGAEYMATYGRGNPSCQTVYDAERAAIRLHREMMQK